MKRYLVILLIAICLLFPTGAHAQDALDELAVVLVIDNSGSMVTSDPQNLHRTATEIFIDLLSPNDRVAVITFEDAVQTIVAMKPAGDAASKKQIKDLVSGALIKKGDTDYLGAMKAASAQLQGIDATQYKKIVVFLTDGKPDRPEWETTPGAQDTYMQNFWNQVTAMAQEEIMVHSVGFSAGLEGSVLQRTAEITSGTSRVMDAPAALIQNFFETLRVLKNRTLLKDETIQVNGSQVMNLSMDQAAAQTRFVLVHPGQPTMQLKTTDNSGLVAIDRYPDYDILTVEGGHENLKDIPIEIAGTGTVRLIADQDPLVKIQIAEPLVNSVQPLGEPIQVKALLVPDQEQYKDDFALTAVMYEADVKLSEVPLERTGDLYIGTIPAIDKKGNYRLEVIAMLRTTEMSRTEATYYLRNLPVIRTDTVLEGEQYPLGEQLNIQAGLQLNNLPVKQGQNVEITEFTLYTDGQEMPFTDDGSSADLKPDDGIWTTTLIMDTPGERALEIMVRGNIEGIPFRLLKAVGQIQVYGLGQFTIEASQTNFTLYPDQITPIPVRITSDSQLDEQLIITVEPSEKVSLQQQFIDVKATEKKSVELGLKLLNADNEEQFPVTILFAVDQGEQRTQVGTVNLQVEISSFWKSSIQSLKAIFDKVRLPASLLGGLAVILFGGEYLLRKRNIRSGRMLSGQLSYGSVGQTEPAVINFEEHTKSQYTIAFGKGKKSDLVIEWAEAPYTLKISSKVASTGRQKFWGWKRLFKGFDTVSKLYAEVDYPGIISTGDQAHAKLFLIPNQPFKVAGVEFIYKASEQKAKAGRNVLQDRDL